MASSIIGKSRMVWSTTGGSGNFRSRKQAEEGFSLIEVLISMVILTVGMVSLLGVFGLAMSTTQASQQNMIAKQPNNKKAFVIFIFIILVF